MSPPVDVLPIAAFTRSVFVLVCELKPAHRSADDAVYRPNAFGADWTLDRRPDGEARRSVAVWKQGDDVAVSRRDGKTEVGERQTIRRDEPGVAAAARLVAWIWDGGAA